MSACISRHGEYSEHVLNAGYVCQRCLVFDEDGLLAAISRVKALHRPDSDLQGTVCEHDHFPWPCLTILALSSRP